MSPARASDTIGPKAFETKLKKPRPRSKPLQYGNVGCAVFKRGTPPRTPRISGLKSQILKPTFLS